jgi:AcrR family transcriptional regulator
MATNNDMRERVLDTAATLFVRDGYSRTSMKAIARELGITAPTLYWYFDSKQNIFSTLMESTLRDFNDEIRRGVEGDTPTEQLRSYVITHVRQQLNHRDTASIYDSLYRLWLQEQQVSKALQRSVNALMAELVAIPRTIIEAGNATGELRVPDPSVAARAIVTMVDQVYLWFDPGRPLDVDEVAASYAGLVLAMCTSHLAGAEPVAAPALSAEMHRQVVGGCTVDRRARHPRVAGRGTHRVGASPARVS